MAYTTLNKMATVFINNISIAIGSFSTAIVIRFCLVSDFSRQFPQKASRLGLNLEGLCPRSNATCPTSFPRESPSTGTGLR